MASTGGEDVAPPAVEPARDPRRERLVVQPVIPRQSVELPDRRQVERAVDPVHLAVGGIAAVVPAVQPFLVDDHPGDGVVGLGGDLDPHRLAALPGLEPVLDQLEHVVGLLFQELDVTVAGDAKDAPRLDRESAEQFRQPGGDDVFQQHERLRARLAAVQGHDPGQHLRHLHDGEQPAGPQPFRAVQHDAEVQAAIVVAGRGMGGIDRHRREDRQRPFPKEAIDLHSPVARSRRRPVPAGPRREP